MFEIATNSIYRSLNADRLFVPRIRHVHRLDGIQAQNQGQ